MKFLQAGVRNRFTESPTSWRPATAFELIFTNLQLWSAILMTGYTRIGLRAAMFVLPSVMGLWPTAGALATDTDTFVTNVGGQVTIGGAENLETLSESFELTSKVFYAAMVPNPDPLDPHDYGFDDPGFFALGSTRVTDFPPSTSALPGGADVTLHFPSFTVAGNTDTLFYWNGSGAVNFQPISTTQPGYAIAVGANPVATTSNDSPTDYGALHEHPGFTLDNGGPGTPAEGIYLNAGSISVPGLTDSKNYYYVWVIDSLIAGEHKEDIAVELRDALLDHVIPPIVEGKDFTFVNDAISFVQNNLVVPEPSGAALVGILACMPLFRAVNRRRRSAVSNHTVGSEHQ
jgi:hypothetical protein